MNGAPKTPHRPCTIFPTEREALILAEYPTTSNGGFYLLGSVSLFSFRGASCHSIAFLPTTAKNTKYSISVLLSAVVRVVSVAPAALLLRSAWRFARRVILFRGGLRS